MTEDSEKADGLSGSIQSIDRCGQVLRLVAREGSVRAALVASELKLQRSTAHRYLASMEDAAMLLRDADGSYRAGPLLAQLGVLAMRTSNVVEEAQHFMEPLAKECQQTVVLCVWGGRTPVVARVQEANDRIAHVTVREGVQLSIDSSHGHLFASHLAELPAMRRALSEANSAERHAVIAAIPTVLEHGFAEHAMAIRGIRAIAAPIFHADGSMAASLALAGTTEGIPAGFTSGYATALKTAAAQISERLGFNGVQSRQEGNIT